GAGRCRAGGGGGQPRAAGRLDAHLGAGRARRDRATGGRAGGGGMSDPSRELLEQQIRETEERCRTMADAAPVLLWMSRTDGMCTFFNQTWLDFTGRS